MNGFLSEFRRGYNQDPGRRGGNRPKINVYCNMVSGSPGVGEWGDLRRADLIAFAGLREGNNTSSHTHRGRGSPLISLICNPRSTIPCCFDRATKACVGWHINSSGQRQARDL
jgi:hypothetical protein